MLWNIKKENPFYHRSLSRHYAVAGAPGNVLAASDTWTGVFILLHGKRSIIFKARKTTVRGKPRNSR